MAINIHATSEVQTNAIGDGTTIWQYCVILKGAVIGTNCNINFNVFVENKVTIGNNVTIKPGVQIWDGISINDNVFIGPNVTFTNDSTPRSKRYPLQYKKIIIHEGASIGANSTLIAGIHIGKYAMIGAGSVVTKNIPPFTLWYGNPATHRGYVTIEGDVVNMDLMDKKGRKYKIINKIPILLK